MIQHIGMIVTGIVLLCSLYFMLSYLHFVFGDNDYCRSRSVHVVIIGGDRGLPSDCRD